MGWIWNMFWHSYSTPIPLLLVPRFDLYHLKTMQTKMSHDNAESRTECWSFCGRRCWSLQGDDTCREKCFMPQGNDLSGSLLEKVEWWWSSGSGLYEAVDGIKTNTIKKFVMWYSTPPDSLLRLLIGRWSTLSCPVTAALAITPMQTQIHVNWSTNMAERKPFLQ